MRIAPITSMQNPRVKAVVKLRDQRGRRAAGLFVAEGHREVERAVAAGLPLCEAWLCAERLGLPIEEIEPYVERVFGSDCPHLHLVPPEVFDKIAYVRDPEGVLGVFEPPRWGWADLPGVATGAMDLVAVGTEKPGNLGAMVRTADAAGCRAVIAAGTPVDAMNPNAIRASTAAVFHVPTLSMPEDEAIEKLSASGSRIIAAYPENATDYTRVDYAGPIAIAIGPEDRGLSPAWRDAAEATGGACVRIPMAGRTADSLNASIAAAVLLFEAVRQRRAAGLQ